MHEVNFLIRRKFFFNSAHHLPGYNGPCAKVHGHTWELTVEVICPIHDDGISFDFRELKAVVEPLISIFDHEDINTIVPIPTAEEILLFIWTYVDHKLPKPVILNKLYLKEGRDTEAILEAKEMRRGDL